VNRTFNKIRERKYQLQAGNDAEKLCQQCNTYAASHGPRPGTMAKYISRISGSLFKG
jgi:hypothetical protein